MSNYHSYKEEEKENLYLSHSAGTVQEQLAQQKFML